METLSLESPAHDVDIPASSQIIPGRARMIRAEGATWVVYERELQVPEGRVRTLIFDSPHIMRRVRRYPATWYRLTQSELEAIVATR